jgi:hypothetical protein
MDTNGREFPWLPREYFENRRNFPQDELLKYAGKHVAFSWDGTRIVASGESDEDLERNLAALGIDPERVVGAYLDPVEGTHPDEPALRLPPPAGTLPDLALHSDRSTNMDTNGREIPWLTREFFENRRKFPQEELLKYAGKHVAFSWDGTRIVASGDSYEDLERNMAALGVDPERVASEYVEPYE